MSEDWVRWILSGLGGVITLMFGEMFRRLFKRQDELEARKANVTSTDHRFEQLIDELKQHRMDLKSHEVEDRNMHKDVLSEIRETNRHLSMTNATLSNLVGRFDATNGHQ